MMKRKPLVALILLVALSGCAKPSMYNWDGYSTSMYSFYRHPDERQKFTDSLNTIIADNEKAGTRVPPGIYAEYGYMMLSADQTIEAVTYFKKEQDAWPEATKFMKTMIALAKTKNLAKSTNPVPIAQIKTGNK